MNPFLAVAARVASVCVFVVTGCSSPVSMPAQGPVARAARPSSSPPVARRPALRAERSALPSLSEGDSDCVFLANAARAVEQYQAFIQRAGTAPEYATALERSRDQVTDLQAEMEFVRSGMAQRGARCVST